MSDTTTETPITEIARTIITSLVDYPDQLVITETIGRSSVIIGVASPKEKDISQIIGKRGTTITAIKQLIEQIARKRKIRCTIYVD
jgi:predicted RNA-binding protein YlqC (UPF0109 family)